MRRRTGLLSLLLCLAACAGTPEAPAPGRSLAWGYLRLVPREGVVPGGHGSASYGDRRLRDVELVDYSSPGFAVVYADGGEAPAGLLEIAIRSSRVIRLEPSLAAVGAAGRVAVENATGQPHLLSYPAAGLVRRLAPGERIELAVPRPGEQGVFLLDVADASATLFASSGPYAVVSSAGRFELSDLEPGVRGLHAWHPRFPPTRRSVVLEPGARLRVDLEVGVGLGAGEAHHGH